MADSGAAGRRWSRNRVLPAVCLGLILLLVILAVAGGSKKSTTKSEPTARSLVVEAAEQPVTVFVPACETPAGTNTTDAPGTTGVKLPPGRGVRTVVVPNCTTGTGTQPSAALVLQNDSELQPGTSAPPGTVPPGLIVGSRLTLPAGSEARTVVVPPCGEKSKAKEDVVLRPDGGTVTAPAC